MADLLLLAFSHAVSPERVAIHFSAGGNPDNWAPSHINTLLMAGLHTLVFVSLFFSTRLTRILHREYVNLPNKSYWTRDANWSRAESMLTREM